MTNIVLVSHGNLCESLLESLEMICGDTFGIVAVPLNPEESPESYRNKLFKELMKFDGNDDFVILSDIVGGTPFISAAYLSRKYNIGLITGVNLPMLITIALETTPNNTIEEIINKAVSETSIGITQKIF